MANPDSATPRLHALLIGVNCYLPNTLPGGGTYPSLRGCVRDIQTVAGFLHTRLGVPDAQVRLLTATDNGAGKPAEPSEAQPTYENMVRAFRDLTGRAKPGDQVYIHYSGHGGRPHGLSGSQVQWPG